MRYRILFVLLFSICFVQSFSQSQTLYELKYHFSDSLGTYHVKALFLRNGDGTGIIRINFVNPEDKSRNLYKMDVEEAYDEDSLGRVDSGMLIYAANSIETLMGDTSYRADHFIFSYNPKTKYYEPAAVVSFMNDDDPDDTTYIEGVFDSQTLLNQKDLTKQFLLQYFLPDEDEFKAFFEEQATVRKPMFVTNPKMHLILVANTNDESIGKTCAVDRDATKNAFSDIAEFLSIPFDVKEISGNDFKKKTVEATVKEINPSPQDIVVFYYSGHGFNYTNKQNQYPFLDLRDKMFQQPGGEYTMNIEDIYNMIVSKGARLNLVMSDCCNSLIDATTKIGPDAPSTRTSTLGWNRSICQSLFLNPEPFSLLITAASKGEYSAGTLSKGGLFTFNFRQSLVNLIGFGRVSATWPEIVAAAQSQTKNMAQKTICGKTDKGIAYRCSQTPVFRAVGK